MNLNHASPERKKTRPIAISRVRREQRPTDRRTDGPTDGPTDRVAYRVACTRLKKHYSCVEAIKICYIS